jgi:peptide/nickel transport system ATP-binding protein
MYVGRIVELAPTAELFANPRHPYTEVLLSAVPTTDPTQRKDRLILEGEPANAANLPQGCYFHPRCKYCTDICKKEYPPFVEIGNGHSVACHQKKLI